MDWGNKLLIISLSYFLSAILVVLQSSCQKDLVIFFVVELGVYSYLQVRLRDDTPDNTSTPFNAVHLFMFGTPFHVMVHLLMLVYAYIHMFSHSNNVIYKISQMQTSSLLVS